MITIMVIDGHSINGYWWPFYQWLLVVILLMVIDGYFIGGYWCLLIVVILMAISGCGYSINDY